MQIHNSMIKWLSQVLNTSWLKLCWFHWYYFDLWAMLQMANWIPIASKLSRHKLCGCCHRSWLPWNPGTYHNRKWNGSRPQQTECYHIHSHVHVHNFHSTKCSKELRGKLVCSKMFKANIVSNTRSSWIMGRKLHSVHWVKERGL